MAKPKVYIDGREGTTGLQIQDRLAGRQDIQLLEIDPALRKDPAERRRLMAAADLVFLCLPDAAAIEAVALAEGTKARIIDASTAHRTQPGWVYGLPELCPEQRDAIATAKFVANPGCHPTGAILILRPLIESGLLPKAAPITITSITGYSGGGKKMIAQYQALDRPETLEAPRAYGLTLRHKHLPEIVKYTGLTVSPVFVPVVCDYYAGMETIIGIPKGILTKTATTEDIYDILAQRYIGEKLVKVLPFTDKEPPEGGFLPANLYAGRNDLAITVCGSGEETLICARYDNLGKGASGAAVQNMNRMLGFDETEGLI